MTLWSLIAGWFGAKVLKTIFAGTGAPIPPPAIRPTPRRRPAHRVVRVDPIEYTPQPVKAPPASSYAPPWPQVTPSGLPSFPGPGWEPDAPPPPAVVSRSVAILPQLWRGGPGTFRVEQTAGRWIAYQAVRMGAKKGVVAWRLRPSEAAPPSRGVIPISAPAPVRAAPAGPPTSAVILPTLRRGSRGSDVQILQRRFGITADGIFGPGTERSVKSYQRSHGLQSDGIVGPKTWASLMGRSA